MEQFAYIIISLAILIAIYFHYNDPPRAGRNPLFTEEQLHQGKFLYQYNNTMDGNDINKTSKDGETQVNSETAVTAESGGTEAVDISPNELQEDTVGLLQLKHLQFTAKATGVNLQFGQMVKEVIAWRIANGYSRTEQEAIFQMFNFAINHQRNWVFTTHLEKDKLIFYNQSK